MTIAVLFTALLISQCDATKCAVPPPVLTPEQAAAVAKIPPYHALIEVVSRATGRIVHRARGQLSWGKKKHIGGLDLRDTGFDAPDYEINARLVRPREVWVST